MPTTSTDVLDTTTRSSRLRDLGGVVAGGAFMGAAEIVPGVSGGTIALVFGIYDRLIGALSDGATSLGRLVRGDLRGGIDGLRAVEWPFVVALLAGMGTAIAVLSGPLHTLLDTQPVALSALFMGLVGGSVVLARRELHGPLSRADLVLAVGVAVVTFVGLGLTTGRVTDPTLPLFFVAAAVAICAMVLPGISGSFILLLVGMYEPVLAAASERDVVTLVTFAAGAVVGLGLFASLLHRTLERAHDRTLAILLGLMAGSLRVLWPWPAGSEGVGDARLGTPVADEVGLAIAMAVVGLAMVVGIAHVGDRTVGDRTVGDDDQSARP